VRTITALLFETILGLLRGDFHAHTVMNSPRV
jgi:hypothetical protein